ncbi:MAG: lytic transglycosylase domain-containing protein [Caulobacteraceae bacterium]
MAEFLVAQWTRMLMAAACVAAFTGSAVAQPEAQDTPAPAPMKAAPEAPLLPPPTANDIEWVKTGVAAARAGNLEQMRTAIAAVAHPTARKLLEYLAADNMAARMSFAEIDRARRDLDAWPHKAGRQISAERGLEASGLSPQQVADWFRAEPVTAEGAMALANAYQQLGRAEDMKVLVQHFWRDRSFDADAQRLFLVRFGSLLTVEDHVRRADTLLYQPKTPALDAVLGLVPEDWRKVADARIALRAGARDADALYAQVPAEHLHDPGLAVARARWLYDRDRGQEALSLIADFPKDPPEDASSGFWLLRRQLVNVAVKAGDYAAAHKAVDAHGLKPGPDAADAEFLGGWLALTKLHDAEDAEQHFARLEVIGASPITASRALYWRGRAMEAIGDPIAAQTYYGRGAKYYTTFYGQMAAAKAGMTEIDLGKDPVPTALDRARYEANELVTAARLLHQAGARDLYRSMLVAAVDSLPRAVDIAQLIDMAEDGGQGDLTMRLARLAAQRGLVLPERGYPVREPPETSPVEASFVLGIIRQESGFDARIKSSVGARGMMQLMPATAKGLAKRAGVRRFKESMLDDADFNMRLGSSYLGGLVGEFDGSYIMAAAAYNAGPGRPSQWMTSCGDPRAASVDPVDYIECIPIGETRNYVMRVLENVEVYRARLNGGRAPLTLASDLKRGGVGQPRPYTQVAQNTLSSPAARQTASDVVASSPVPDPPARLIKEADDNRRGKAKAHKVSLESHKASAKAHGSSAKSSHHKAKKRKR